MCCNDQGDQPELCECTSQDSQPQFYDSTPPGGMGIDPLQLYSITLEAILQAQRQLLSLDPVTPLFVAQSATCRVPASCPSGFQGRYTVRRGDTMFFIAQRCGVTLQSLIAANPHIANPNLIFPCDVLCVPPRCADTVTCRVPISCPSGFQGRYTVRSGDTMFFIAQRCGVTLQSLIAANPHITNPNLIFPCDVLCVPPKCADRTATEE
jgi:LysM repeat protein